MTIKIIYTTLVLTAVISGNYLQASGAGDDFSSAIATLQSDAGSFKKMSAARDVLASKTAPEEIQEEVRAILHKLALHEDTTAQFFDKLPLQHRFGPDTTQEDADKLANTQTLEQIMFADTLLEFVSPEDPRKADVLAKLYQIMGSPRSNPKNPYLQSSAAQKFLDYADLGDARRESALHTCHFVLINPDLYRVSLLSLNVVEAVLKHTDLDDARRSDAYSFARSVEGRFPYQVHKILEGYPELASK